MISPVNSEAIDKPENFSLPQYYNSAYPGWLKDYLGEFISLGKAIGYYEQTPTERQNQYQLASQIGETNTITTLVGNSKWISSRDIQFAIRNYSAATVLRDGLGGPKDKHKAYKAFSAVISYLGPVISKTVYFGEKVYKTDYQEETKKIHEALKTIKEIREQAQKYTGWDNSMFLYYVEATLPQALNLQNEPFDKDTLFAPYIFTNIYEESKDFCLHYLADECNDLPSIVYLSYEAKSQGNNDVFNKYKELALSLTTATYINPPLMIDYILKDIVFDVSDFGNLALDVVIKTADLQKNCLIEKKYNNLLQKGNLSDEQLSAYTAYYRDEYNKPTQGGTIARFLHAGLPDDKGNCHNKLTNYSFDHNETSSLCISVSDYDTSIRDCCSPFSQDSLCAFNKQHPHFFDDAFLLLRTGKISTPENSENYLDNLEKAMVQLSDANYDLPESILNKFLEKMSPTNKEFSLPQALLLQRANIDAKEILLRLSENGDGRASMEIARNYMYGINHFEQDAIIARKYINLAYEQENEEAKKIVERAKSNYNLLIKLGITHSLEKRY